MSSESKTCNNHTEKNGSWITLDGVQHRIHELSKYMRLTIQRKLFRTSSDFRLQPTVNYETEEFNHG
ncbi:hypothetical protein Y032_0028g1788 [Ancylostoma ceylanicum]|uniref:Uncharacterized protein n=1 Tax=Ancylostoma ceylanicum TaxID=53326 RepID=A0A016UU05_9BILA|nr:hypothetical protein Y032_0028g1788 [Ancylostoma ceylanicum]